MLEVSKESVIATLQDHGGRIPQKQLSAIYKPLLADKTKRPLFQKIVNQVAFVKTKTEENGESVKVVFLKKELRSSSSPHSQNRSSPRQVIPDAIREIMPAGSSAYSSPPSTINKPTRRISPDRSSYTTSDRSYNAPPAPISNLRPQIEKIRNSPRHSPRQSPRDSPRDSPRNTPREKSRHTTPRDSPRSSPIHMENSPAPKAPAVPRHAPKAMAPPPPKSAPAPPPHQPVKEPSPENFPAPPPIVVSPAPEVAMAPPAPPAPEEFKRPKDLPRKMSIDNSKRTILADKNMNLKLSGSKESLNSLHSTNTNRNQLGDLEKSWFEASMEGNIDEVKSALKEKPEILEHKDYILGYTAAHWAVKTDNVALLKILVASGLDPNCKSHNGGTLLHLAVQSGHYKILDYLLNLRTNATLVVDIHARDNLGKLPRHYLSEENFESEQYQRLVKTIAPPRNKEIDNLPKPEPSAFDNRRRHLSSKSGKDKNLSSSESADFAGSSKPSRSKALSKSVRGFFHREKSPKRDAKKLNIIHDFNESL